MRSPANINIGQRLAALFMIAALAWLTVSLPVVYKAQQEAKSVSKVLAAEEESTTVGNMAEEKSESGVQLSEYMHDTEVHLSIYVASICLYKCHQCSFHLDIHPECFTPPPNEA